jgi:molybdenum cofactor cytidylyltransferase
MSADIHGVILAAGRSSRMSRPKALLEVGSETFLQRAAATLRAGGCAEVRAVVGADAEWAHAAAEDAGVGLVVNADPASEQVDSLRLALEALPATARAVLVLPVDLPLVTEDTVRALVQAYGAERPPLVLPFHNGVAGHPVLLDRGLFAEVLGGGLDEGVRSLIMAHARDMREVKVDDPGILIDIDTPDDYWRYIQRK